MTLLSQLSSISMWVPEIKLRSLLGFCSRHVYQLSHLAAPLSHLFLRYNIPKPMILSDLHHVST